MSKKEKVKKAIKELADRHNIPAAVESGYLTIIKRIDNRSDLWKELVDAIVSRFPDETVKITVAMAETSKLKICKKCTKNFAIQYTRALNDSGLRKHSTWDVNVPYCPFIQAGKTLN